MLCYSFFRPINGRERLFPVPFQGPLSKTTKSAVPPGLSGLDAVHMNEAVNVVSTLIAELMDASKSDDPEVHEARQRAIVNRLASMGFDLEFVDRAQLQELGETAFDEFVEEGDEEKPVKMFTIKQKKGSKAPPGAN